MAEGCDTRHGRLLTLAGNGIESPAARAGSRVHRFASIKGNSFDFSPPLDALDAISRRGMEFATVGFGDAAHRDSMKVMGLVPFAGVGIGSFRHDPSFTCLIAFDSHAGLRAF
jgi:hypothetical protein